MLSTRQKQQQNIVCTLIIEFRLRTYFDKYCSLLSAISNIYDKLTWKKKKTTISRLFPVRIRFVRYYRNPLDQNILQHNIRPTTKHIRYTYYNIFIVTMTGKRIESLYFSHIIMYIIQSGARSKSFLHKHNIFLAEDYYIYVNIRNSVRYTISTRKYISK